MIILDRSFVEKEICNDYWHRDDMTTLEEACSIVLGLLHFPILIKAIMLLITIIKKIQFLQLKSYIIISISIIIYTICKFVYH